MYGLLQLEPSTAICWLWFVLFHLLGWAVPGLTLGMAVRRLDSTERGVLLNWAASLFADALLFGLFCPPFGVAAPETVARVYPAWITVHGLMWFMEARFYWGRLYLIGMLYFAAAVLMQFRIDLAPLIFGLVNAAGLTWMSYGFRSMAVRQGDRSLENPRS
jgi:hypothetical protein